MLYFTLIPTSYVLAMAIFKSDGALLWLSLHPNNASPLQIKLEVMKELTPVHAKNLVKLSEPIDTTVYPIDAITSLIENPSGSHQLADSIRVDYNFLSPNAADITKRVWDYLRLDTIDGQTKSYGEIARDLGVPNSSRAVARACACNKVAVVVPCHRVLTKDGGYNGYRWGVEFKKELLKREGALSIEAN